MTPTNDNATAGAIERTEAELNASELWALDEADLRSIIAALRAMQARVAEVESERDWFAVTVVNLSSQRDAPLSREKKAKAEGIREAAAYLEAGYSEDWEGRGVSYVAADLRALAQSGGADPAQGKGDIATTALAYLVNAQHDLRTGTDPARALATISAGVAAVEAGLAGGVA